MSSSQTQPPIEGSSSLALACIILGCLAFASSCVLIGVLIGLVGLVLGVVHLSGNGKGRGMAWVGIGFSLLGIGCSIGLAITYFQFVKTVYESLERMVNQTDILEDWKGVPMTDVTLTTLDGQTIKLGDLKGKRVVIDVWATWCAPCVSQLPNFVELRKAVAAEELVIIGLSEDDAEKIKVFAKNANVNYPMVSTEELPAPFNQVVSFPTTFFIDRNGVIQDILKGFHGLDELKRLATSADYNGPAKIAPHSDLEDAEVPLKLVESWTTSVPDACSLGVGDWDADGTLEIVVADLRGLIHVFDRSGEEKTSVNLPEFYQRIELGRHRSGPRLLAYSVWGSSVKVFDTSGKNLWDYGATAGIDGAHWGDLDGDGNDEMVIGMNGNGGLHAVSTEGKLLWKDATFENVWNHCIVSATPTGAARIVMTESGGSVNTYDATGRQLTTLRPMEKYFSEVAAARETVDGPIQIVATREETLGMDENGNIAWSTAARANSGNWRRSSFASGDVDGDGTIEWLFVDITGELVLVNPRGAKLATIKPQNFDGFAIVSGPTKTGLVVTICNGKLRARRVAEPESPQVDSSKEDK